jgi:broad specificity phosphatase PhoE
MIENEATLVYVVRHGETEWNLNGKQQGHLDSPLTARGIRQALALAEGLFNRGIKHIFSSDLGRASTTAEIIGKKLGLPVHTDTLLRERNLGSLQGSTKNEWRQQYPDEWAAFDSGDPDYCFPGGESARQRYKRTTDCIENLAEHYRGSCFLVVAHGGVLNGLFYKTIGIPLSDTRRFSLFNAAINSFTVTNGLWHVNTWGETAHLKELKTLDDN